MQALFIYDAFINSIWYGAAECLVENTKELQVCTLHHFSFLRKFYRGKKYFFYFSLLVLLSKKHAQGLLVVFCCMLCIFPIFGQE